MGFPLAGVRVIDVSSTFMGPYCTMLLAQWGAEVTKVEPPGGDVVRKIGDVRGTSMGPVFLNVNRGKRSVVLDLKQGGARGLLDRLVAGADVVVHNMRSGAAERLGLSADAVLRANPRAVHCAFRGFGAGGPYEDRPAYDDVIQAASGMAALQGGAGGAEYVRTAAADKIVGLMGAAAVLAALHGREVTGRGQAVEVPMLETMTQFMLLEQQGGWVFDPPAGPAGYARTASPHRRPCRTKDGHLAVMIYTDAQWRAFFDCVGRPELADDPRYRTIRERTEHIDELYAFLNEEMAARTTADWLAELERRDIPAAPVNAVTDLFEDPHLRATGFFESVEHPSEGPLLLPRQPVRFGQGPRAEVTGGPGDGGGLQPAYIRRGAAAAGRDAPRTPGPDENGPARTGGPEPYDLPHGPRPDAHALADTPDPGGHTIPLASGPHEHLPHAPRLGEHSLDVAREAGLDDAEIQLLVASGALDVPRGDGTPTGRPPRRGAVRSASGSAGPLE
ncbi:CaiB/BaiF CoA transferase family protein [Streptomyces griseorubiginosus]|uniref:CaiB/BaiF CoA transferase family protein n=1 Tax=Streptomyces griseorubiginosus TaxID=67304 RepID=UPI003633D362